MEQIARVQHIIGYKINIVLLVLLLLKISMNAMDFPAPKMLNVPIHLVVTIALATLDISEMDITVMV